MLPSWSLPSVTCTARRIYLNMVAGGFKNDLSTFNDTTPLDKRYARLIDYTTIIKELLAKFPIKRTRRMLDLSGCGMLTSRLSADQFESAGCEHMPKSGLLHPQSL
jgi:alkanesulfonate monooxygenase SsuD/methylene tetrahydromethanopterin reductase-like flavin-dependent oxidoreductase (luciferase family)